MSKSMTHDNDDIDFEPQPLDKLYAHNRRQLSAMLDGELSTDQARFMLRRLQHDAELAECWERWQVCGDILRGRGHALLPGDFSRRVAMAIAASETAAAPVAAAGREAAPARRPQRLVRWGGGALAASVALVALFMARQMPDPQAPELAEAASAARSAPVLVQDAQSAPLLADAGEDLPAAPVPVPAPSQDDDAKGAAGLLAAAAPAALAVAEVPRRAAERGSTRSQSQRVGARRSQAAADARVAAAVAPTPAPAPTPAVVPQAASPAVAQLPAFAGQPPAGAAGEALFGGPPAAATRPWPRAVLPGLSGRRSPFAADYGLPQAGAFAPFQPRLEAVPAAAAGRLQPGQQEEGADAPGPGPASE